MWLGQNSESQFIQHFFKPIRNGARYEIEHREITEIPAKLKCLDEACMNCVDEYNKNLNDKKVPPAKKMNRLSVTLSNNGRRITVEDNGRGIPAENAGQVFLHLMYGENFDDELKKDHVAGQNGVGISLVRIVSKYFEVESHNGKKHYHKLFTVSDKFIAKLKSLKYNKAAIEKIKNYFDEHGDIIDCPEVLNYKSLEPILKSTGMIEKIKPNQAGKHGTKLTFELDETYFNGLDMQFDPDLTLQYLQDIAMTNPGLKVVFKHKSKTHNLQFKKGLEDILKLADIEFYKLSYDNQQKSNPIHIESYFVKTQNRNLSWVNANFASLGGSPFEYLENRICDEVRKKPGITAAEKKLKTQATRNDVRNCFHIYNNWHILNPRFKSQDKSYLINDLNEEIRQAVDKNLDKLIRKLDLLNEVKAQMEKRTRLKAIEDAARDLNRANRNKIAKLVPATGKASDPDRSLLIAEGDSAVAGLRPVRTPGIHALFPLRGKPLNVKGMSLAKAMANEEIKNLVAIIGLPLKGKVSSLDELNYRRVSIITDADYDGYAIRSLILSFFLEYWPEVFDLGLIYYTAAPLFEVDVKKKGGKAETIFCIDEKDFEKLAAKVKRENGEITRKKRNKGLGETSRAAMKYALDQGMIKITVDKLPAAKKVQDLWFHKDMAEARRKTISEYAQLFFDD